MIELDLPALLPPRFARALEGVRAARVRSEVAIEAIPAPTRMAPHAVALSATVAHAGADGREAGGPDDREPVTGRLVLLHDPAGQPSWEGVFRVVTLTRAVLDPALVGDPMMGAVAWSWLLEALAAHDLEPVALGGTVTRVLSEPFGDLSEDPWEQGGGPVEGEVELRASWTPTEAGAGASVAAWTDLLCSAAGRPDLPDGVAPLVPRAR